VSLLTNRPVRCRVAMTGEITLSGRVLPVGGIKEKVLAAHRLGIKEVLVPRRNEKAVKEDIPENVRNDLKLHLVSTIEEVLGLALTPRESLASGKVLEVAAGPAPQQFRN
jgi:ATP-dependent Lon protease